MHHDEKNGILEEALPGKAMQNAALFEATPNSDGIHGRCLGREYRATLGGL